MPQARDRRSNPVDVAAVFARRRSSILGPSDDGLDALVFGSTPRQAASPLAQIGSGQIRIGFATTRRSTGRVSAGLRLYGAENNSPLGSGRRGRGRGNGGAVLPSWYTRTPLRDITAVVRAIERRRARLGENEGQQIGTPFPADRVLPDPSVSIDGASLLTPEPALLGVKLQTPGGKVPKILLEIKNQAEGESELTPEKKLLNSIDSVEKVVREELQRLKRTPSAKKAEREKRVRTLMSMR